MLFDLFFFPWPHHGLKDNLILPFNFFFFLDLADPEVSSEVKRAINTTLTFFKEAL